MKLALAVERLTSAKLEYLDDFRGVFSKKAEIKKAYWCYPVCPPSSPKTKHKITCGYLYQVAIHSKGVPNLSCVFTHFSRVLALRK
jgi:hypothetical protein